MMGRVIPFPTKKMEVPVEKSQELTDMIIKDKILAGEAELVGVFNQNGFLCSCYRMEFDHQSYYVFDLTTKD
ncbi:MAG TPA: hypothetical protein DDW93_04415 [Firmicutes bacterium]|jgi:hypothetical protein|nr:hypothetical protein [Bacillota bacterium]HBK68938.1 hypothetical protein [Bacillota bacterium]HBT17034.1 hypothetical protein [Bacillota bacterium]